MIMIIIIVCMSVCRGTSLGLAHNATYRQYEAIYTGCTYVVGNVELVYLTNQTNYDLSFLKVPRFELLRHL